MVMKIVATLRLFEQKTLWINTLIVLNAVMNYAPRKCLLAFHIHTMNILVPERGGLDCFSVVLSNAIHINTLPWFSLFFHQTHQNNRTKLFQKEKKSLLKCFSLFSLPFSHDGEKGYLVGIFTV